MEGESSHYTNKLHGNSNCGQQQYMNSTSTKNSHCDKHLRILYYNARGLLPKLDELHIDYNQTPPYCLHCGDLAVI